MKFTNNKRVFYTILVFCIIFFILSLTGILLKVFGYGKEPYVDPNPQRLFKLDGKLYFYNEADELLGTYTCINNDSYCGYAYEYTDDDKNSDLLTYDDGKTDVFKLINNRYALLNDTNDKTEYYRNSKVILYDVIENKKLNEFKAVKNYTIGMSNHLIFAMNDANLWQVISLGNENPLYVTKAEYNYLGVHNRVVDGMIDAHVIMAYKNGFYVLLNDTGSNKTERLSAAIADYNDNYIISKSSNNMYSLMTVNSYRLLNGEEYRKMYFVGKYVGVVDNDYKYYLLDYSYNKAVSEKYSTTSSDKVTEVVLENGNVEIYINDNLIETVK